MRKRIKVAIAILISTLALACYIVPVEDGEEVIYYTSAPYCEDIPGRGQTTSCNDVSDSHGHYIGTCCEVYYPASRMCMDGPYRMGHYETWCQWDDSCDWLMDGYERCFSDVTPGGPTFQVY